MLARRAGQSRASGRRVNPDAAGQKKANGDDYFAGAPLVAIEVASESQNAAHLEAKAEMYLSRGGREVWLVFPMTRRVWICRAGASTIEVQESAIRSELLPGVELRFFTGH